MKKKWIFVIAPPAAVLALWLFGEIVKSLWNWLLPPLFGWHTVTFWQGLGMLVLCRILFGGYSNDGNRGPGRRHGKSEKREAMTPEEREKLRQSMGHHGGSFSGPGSESNEPA